MKKSDVTNYSQVLIQADIDFIKYQIDKKQVNLIDGTGLKKLIEDVEFYQKLSPEALITNKELKPLLVAYSLSDTMRILWMKDIDFTIQLRALNTGDFSYGQLSPEKENNFKDFELEMFSTAYLSEYGLNVTLPQHTEGNDIFFKDIEIQCKHPDTFTRDKIDKFLRAFQSSLQKSNHYGIFGLGVDDFLGFTETEFPYDDQKFQIAYRQRLQQIDKTLSLVFDDTLKYCPRVLGVYLINTHYTYMQSTGLTLTKTTNSVFCLRPNAKEVSENSHRHAYELLTVFNHKPSIRSY